LIVVWAPGKFFFVHILFCFIQLTSFTLFTGFNLQQRDYHDNDDNDGHHHHHHHHHQLPLRATACGVEMGSDDNRDAEKREQACRR
jgi:hypothetical protein